MGTNHMLDCDALRWISRDPSGENSGINLYEYVFNSPIIGTDALGLDVSGPGTPHVSGDRHNNYLVFKISCPKCKKVANVKADYNSNAMFQDMLNASGGGPGGTYNLNTYEQEINAALSTHGGGAGFGGLQDVGASNCNGDPVEVHAYTAASGVTS